MKNLIYTLIIAFSISSCDRNQVIDLNENCLNEINLTYFRGIYPSIEIPELYKILGQPDEEFVIDDKDEPGIDLAYYDKNGRVLIHWSGEEIDETGMIEFRPKIDLTVKDFLRKEVILEKKYLKIKCNQKQKITIYLNEENNLIKEINWWFN